MRGHCSARALIGLVVLTVVAASPTGADDGALYEHYAGDPLTHINYHRIVDWRVVGPDLLRVRMRGEDYYLIQVGPPCREYDLRTSATLKLPSGSRINRLNRFDTLSINNMRCEILSLRALDYEALQAGGGNY